MSVQCGSMNSSTTTLPRRADSVIVRPVWSVRVKPGAGLRGSGVSSISLARLVGTLAGMPEGRGAAACGWRTMTNMAAAIAMVATTASAPSRMTRPGDPPGPGACWPGLSAAAPLVSCWPGVALVVMKSLFLARPVGTARSHPEHSGTVPTCSCRTDGGRAALGRPEPGAPARSGRLAADEEHRRVVVERVADVAPHLRAQHVQDPVGVVPGLADGAALGEREELAGPVAGLADPVGVEQDPVAPAGLDHGPPGPRWPGGPAGRARRRAAPGPAAGRPRPPPAAAAPRRPSAAVGDDPG